MADEMPNTELAEVLNQIRDLSERTAVLEERLEGHEKTQIERMDKQKEELLGEIKTLRGSITNIKYTAGIVLIIGGIVLTILSKAGVI